MGTAKDCTLPDGRPVIDLDQVVRDLASSVMRERGISEAEFARILGVSQTNVNRVMNGGGTTLKFLARFAALVGEHPAALLSRHPLAPTRPVPTFDPVRAASHFARLALLEGRPDLAHWLLDMAIGKPNAD